MSATPAFILGTFIAIGIEASLGARAEDMLLGWMISMILGGILFMTGILKE